MSAFLASTSALIGAMLIGTAILTALGAWFATAVRDAPLGCDDCQGGDPYCTCHLHADCA